MYGKRSSDPSSATHFRSDRISLVNGRYYFETREGTLKGPYATRDEAQQAIGLYIQWRRKLEPRRAIERQ